MNTLQLPPIEITDELLEFFTDRKGFFEDVVDPTDESKTIPNPKSRSEHAIEFMTEEVLKILVEDGNNAIDVYFNEQRDIAKVAKKAEIASMIKS